MSDLTSLVRYQLDWWQSLGGIIKAVLEFMSASLSWVSVDFQRRGANGKRSQCTRANPMRNQVEHIHPLKISKGSMGHFASHLLRFFSPVPFP